MATDTQIKVRTAIALDRLMQAAGRLAERFPAVQAPQIPTRNRYPEMLPTLQAEAMADFLDALDTELGGGPDMGAMTRAEMNEYAENVGVDDPASYANKDELAAIEGAESPADETQGYPKGAWHQEDVPERTTVHDGASVAPAPKKGKAS